LAPCAAGAGAKVDGNVVAIVVFCEGDPGRMGVDALDCIGGAAMGETGGLSKYFGLATFGFLGCGTCGCDRAGIIRGGGGGGGPGAGGVGFRDGGGE